MDSDEIDQFSDVHRNETVAPFKPNMLFWTMELVKFLISIAAIVCNFLIIYAILKLRQFNDSKLFFVFNWAIANILTCLISPYMVFLIRVVFHGPVEDGYDGMACLLLQIESAFLFLNFTVAFVLTLDWIISNIFQSYYALYKDKFVFVKIVFYVYCALYVWFSMMYCLSNWRDIQHVTLLNGLKFLVVYLALLHIFRYVYSRRRNLLLRIDFTIILPTGFVCCWLPYLVVHMSIADDNTPLPQGGFHVGLYFFAECCTYANAILSTYLLSRNENDLKEKFMEALRCQFRDQPGYPDVYVNNCKE